jgi:hypothetical protein
VGAFVEARLGLVTDLTAIASLCSVYSASPDVALTQTRPDESRTVMKLRHLEYFVAAAEELNFTHAADRMHVSQPPFSKQIQDLEGELGVNLFQRERKGVALTMAGRSFLKTGAPSFGKVPEGKFPAVLSI